MQVLPRPVPEVLHDIRRLQDELKKMDDAASDHGTAQARYVSWRESLANNSAVHHMSTFRCPPSGPSAPVPSTSRHTAPQPLEEDPEWTFGDRTAAIRAQEEENPYARPTPVPTPVLPVKTRKELARIPESDEED